MISVEEAQTRLLELVSPLKPVAVPISSAGGLVLGADQFAGHDQPPFDASAMDGYALRRADVVLGTTLRQVGISAAGAPFKGRLSEGETVRIFTGGAVPEAADMVLIQENVSAEGGMITVTDADQAQDYIRKRGQDFQRGDRVAEGTYLSAAAISLLAGMGIAKLPCHPAPQIAIIATGDELVDPGGELTPGAIYTSNSYGLKAAFEAAGAQARILPIARDTHDALQSVFLMAQDADLIVTSGGASVGDHDLVMPVAKSLGLSSEFHRVRMRPGKPLMAGRFSDGPAFVGLPGNPVSALVCAEVFVAPMIRKMRGLTDVMPRFGRAELQEDLPENGPREHYMRATATFQDNNVTVRAFDRQDSALSSVMAAANALIRRAPDAPAIAAGAQVDVLLLTKV